MKKTALCALVSGMLMLSACNRLPLNILGGAAPVAQGTPTTSEAVKATAVSVNVSSVKETLDTKSKTHETPADATWNNSTETLIELKGASAASGNAAVKINGGVVSIGAAGSYRIRGKLDDGQIVVNSADKESVRLIFDGADITNRKGAPIVIEKASKAILVLADNTQNSVTDAAKYVFADPKVDEPNAAIFSKSDLTIDGNGVLTVKANFNDGIASKDGLVIMRGVLNVNAADDAIRGKNYLVIHDGTFNLTSKGDGLKSDHEEDAKKGYILIDNGTFSITTSGDAIQAHTDVLVKNGKFTLASGGGSAVRPNDSVSTKGVKSGVSMVIDGGTFAINASDDAVHTNGTLTINGGTFELASGDDAVHADKAITINNGKILIMRSYEGIESSVITVNNGDINLTAQDDGVNVATKAIGTTGGMFGGGRGGPPPGGPGGNANYTGSNYLFMNGGRMVVNTTGDGVDVNGAIEMTGGTIIVNGPTEQMNGALDYDGFFRIKGGTLVAAGSSGMAQTPGAVSTQPALLIYFTAAQPAGTLVSIRNKSGESIITFKPTKAYQSLAFSSSALTKGSSYDIYLGGTPSGNEVNGIYTGAISGGTLFQSFTVNDTVTTIGTGGRGPRGPRP
ncbi:MAG: carbohydrate-binding domain-containing protein [Anaerolineae bacterium]|nr:carbohydrate-binding domain-containing protein [Anaerolineae bacterium]